MAKLQNGKRYAYRDKWVLQVSNEKQCRWKECEFQQKGTLTRWAKAGVSSTRKICECRCVLHTKGDLNLYVDSDGLNRRQTSIWSVATANLYECWVYCWVSWVYVNGRYSTRLQDGMNLATSDDQDVKSVACPHPASIFHVSERARGGHTHIRWVCWVHAFLKLRSEFESSTTIGVPHLTIDCTLAEIKLPKMFRTSTVANHNNFIRSGQGNFIRPGQGKSQDFPMEHSRFSLNLV